MSQSIKPQKIAAADLGQFIDNYRESVLWVSHDDNGDDLRGYEVAPCANAVLYSMAARFAGQYAADLMATHTVRPYGRTSWGNLGYRLAMSQLETGVGFTDDDGSPLSERLEQATGHGTAYPVLELYVGDDRRVYILGHEGRPHE